MPGKQTFDPMSEVGASDQKHLAEMDKAKKRQEAAWDSRGEPLGPEDAERKRLSDEFRAKNMAAAGITPADIAKRLEGMPPPQTEEEAVAAAEGVMPRSPQMEGSAQVFSVLTASSQSSGMADIPSATKQYAPDWKLLKERIKDHEGTWVVERHAFKNNVALVLGFFGKPDWESPEDTVKESFEVIVKGGRVFRTDPE